MGGGGLPYVLSNTWLELSIPAGEYAEQVWGRSSHTKKVGIVVNENFCIVTGWMRPTSTYKLYTVIGIAPTTCRRKVVAEIERAKKVRFSALDAWAFETTMRLKSQNILLLHLGDHFQPRRPAFINVERDAKEMQPHSVALREEGYAGSNLPFTELKVLNQLIQIELIWSGATARVTIVTAGDSRT